MPSEHAAARPQDRARTELFWVKLLYLLIFASYGTASAYLTLYFRRIGLNNAEIGILLGLQPVAMLISGPAWSILADRLGMRARLLTIVLALSIVPGLAIMWVTSFAALLALTVLTAAMMGPVTPLLDSIALDNLGEERHRYGTIRAYGSLGYMAVVWAVGALIQVQDIRWIFVLNALLIAASCTASLRLTQQPRTLPASVGRGLGTLIRVPGLLAVMSAYFVAMVLQGVTYGFANLYMDQLGAGESLMGLSQAISSGGQVIVMIYILPGALRRWGSQWLLIASLVCYALKVGIWVVVPHPVAVGLSQLLTGVSFGAAAVATVDFAARHAPAGQEVTAQSLVSGLMAGSGRAVGSAVGGALYDGVGPRNAFGLFTALGLVAAVGYGILWVAPRRGTSAPREEATPRSACTP